MRGDFFSALLQGGGVSAAGFCPVRRATNAESPGEPSSGSPGDSHGKWAATCSPACQGSTIGAGGLNFSVRDGKRWDTAAIAAIIACISGIQGKEEQRAIWDTPPARKEGTRHKEGNFRAISSARL